MDGAGHSFAPLEGEGPKVLVFVSPDCPISNAYAPMLRDLAGRHEVRFFFVHVDPELAAEVAEEHRREYDLPGPALLDPERSLTRRFGPTVTPEVVLVDADGDVRYQGRIDDRFPALGVRRAEPRRRDLDLALAAVLAGEEVEVPRTEAVGCLLPDLPR